MDLASAQQSLFQTIKRSAHAAMRSGENPLDLLYGYAGETRQMVKGAIVEAMRDAVSRAGADAAFYRQMNAKLGGRQ